MWIIFAILTVLFWGTSETIFKGVSNDDEHSILKLIAYNGIILGIVAVILWLITGTTVTLENILSYLPASLIFIVSMFAAYKAMKCTFIGIISPIQNASCALTTILCVLVLKQSMTLIQIVGVLGVIGGIVTLTCIKPKDITQKNIEVNNSKTYLVGIMYALIYFTLDGVGSFLTDYLLVSDLSAEQLNISFSIIYCVIGVISWIILRSKGVKDTFSFNKDKRKIIGTLLETIGQYTYVYTFAYGDAAIAAPFIAGYSVVSLILARIFLKEKLNIQQYITIGVIVISLILLAIE